MQWAGFHATAMFTCLHAFMYDGVMNASTTPRPPENLAIKLPPDVAAALHRLAYETGRSKRDLVVSALRDTYGIHDKGAK